MHLRNTLLTVTAIACLASCNEKPESGSGPAADSSKTETAGSAHERLANQVVDSLQEFADVILDVKDVESAKDVADTLDKIGDRFVVIAAELKTMDPPAETLRAAIDQKMEARNTEMQRVMQGPLQETLQELDLESAQILQKSLMGFFKKMDEVGPEFERHFKGGE